MTTVELTPEELAKLANRLRRAQGQIGGVLRMIEEGRDCQEIVMQLAAVRRAVDRVGFSIIATGLKPVSYTHLDVYKRQPSPSAALARIRPG